MKLRWAGLVLVLGFAPLCYRECSAKRRSQLASYSPQEKDEASRAGGEPLRRPAVAKLSLIGRVRDQTGCAIAETKLSLYCINCETIRAADVAHADSNGLFSLRAVAGAKYQVEAWKDGFYPTSITLDFDSGSAQFVEITLKKGGAEITGVVRDRFGGPIAGAQVSVRHEDESSERIQTVTRKNGTFRLWVDARSEVKIGVTFEGYVPATLSTFAPSTGLVISMLPASTIFGRVVEANSLTPKRGIAVLAEHRDTMRSSEAISDSGGAFEFTALSPGVHDLRILDPVWVSEPLAVSVGYASHRDDIQVYIMKGKVVSGRLEAPGTMKACRGSVYLNGGAEDGYSGAIGAGGSFQVTGVKSGTYVAAVDCGTYVLREHPKIVRVEDHDLLDVVFDVDEGRTISGHVTDSDHQPIPNATVIAYWASMTPGREEGKTVQANADGNFRLEGLWNEHCTIEASRTIGAVRRKSKAIELDLREEDQNGIVLSIDANSPAGFRGQVFDQNGNGYGLVLGSLCLPGTMLCYQGLTDSDGYFGVTGVPDGVYSMIAVDPLVGALTVPGNEVQTASVAVEIRLGRESTPSIVVARPKGRISGRIIDGFGYPVPDALVTVVKGDIAAKDLASVVGPWISMPRSVIADTNGGFEVREVGARSYTVLAEEPGGRMGLKRAVKAGDNIVLVVSGITEGR